MRFPSNGPEYRSADDAGCRARKRHASRSMTGLDCLEAYARRDGPLSGVSANSHCAGQVTFLRPSRFTAGVAVYVLGTVRPQCADVPSNGRGMCFRHPSLTLPRSSQAHVSRESCEEVSLVMSHLRPTHVLVELCKARSPERLTVAVHM
jgi:hypothetical protein